ncbi:hypothetical protein G6F42_009196 [Rhizopus arrhizus]|nr:hypothetical protein G6F42_009196 [Rhizopus arrhizus]
MADQDINEIIQHVKSIESIVKESSTIIRTQQDLLYNQIAVMEKIHDALGEMKLQQKQQFQQLAAAAITPTAPKNSKKLKE